MVQITYGTMVAAISLLWMIVRVYIRTKQKVFIWKREMQLLLVYICLVVVARFVFFPLSKVNGVIQPLVLDMTMAYPFRINLRPFVYLMDYEFRKEAWLNLIGNTAMFIPVGIVWPSVFPKLNTHKKVLAAGIGFSLCIEILQLPIYDRISDIDDLILNSIGFAVGYGLFLLRQKITKSIRIKKAINRVQRMERIFDELSEAQHKKIREETSVLQEKRRVLMEYYDGGQWMQDYQMDERGELPQGLKRGVLSEDGVYHLLTDLEQEEP